MWGSVPFFFNFLFLGSFVCQRIHPYARCGRISAEPFWLAQSAHIIILMNMRLRQNGDGNDIWVSFQSRQTHTHTHTRAAKATNGRRTHPRHRKSLWHDNEIFLLIFSYVRIYYRLIQTVTSTFHSSWCRRSRRRPHTRSRTQTVCVCFMWHDSETDFFFRSFFIYFLLCACRLPLAHRMLIVVCCERVCVCEYKTMKNW